MTIALSQALWTQEGHRRQEILLADSSLDYFLKKLEEGSPEPEIYLGGQLGVAWRDVVSIERAESRRRDREYTKSMRFTVAFKDPGNAIADWLWDHRDKVISIFPNYKGKVVIHAGTMKDAMQIPLEDLENPSFCNRPEEVIEPEEQVSSIAAALGRREE